MGKVSRIGVAVIAAFLVAGWPSATGTDFARFNLDLPYNAGGSDEEDEEAPETPAPGQGTEAASTPA